MSVESNRLLLKHHLEKLRLPTIRREWEAAAGACANDGRDYGDFLLQLTERELIEREQRAAQRRIKSAKFPVLKTLEDFDFGAQSSINETLVRQLTSGEYLDARENVLMIGNSGTGKTHLATALGFAACAQGKRVRFWSASALVTHMLEMREQRDLKRFFAGFYVRERDHPPLGLGYDFLTDDQCAVIQLHVTRIGSGPNQCREVVSGLNGRNPE